MVKMDATEQQIVQDGLHLSMERHNSCLNTLAVIDYIARRDGPVEELLDGLDEDLRGLPDPISFLKDTNNWVSSDVLKQLYANARRITGEEEVALSIGFESVTHKKLGYITEILLKMVSSPNQALGLLHRINNKFNRNKEIEVKRLPGNRAIFKLYWHRNLDLNRDFCRMNHGVYSAMPTIWGLPPAKIKEVQCQFEGGECCEFEASWDKLPLWRRFGLLFNNKGRLVSQTLSEIERDKQLLENKYSEIELLNKQLTQKVDQLLSMQQASGAVLSELDLQALLPTVLNMFLKVIGYDRAILMLVNEQDRVLRYVAGVGGGQEAEAILAGYQVPLSRRENILARVAQTGQAVVAEDISKLNLNPENIIISKFNPESVVVLPLTAQGRVIGVLGADKKSSKGSGSYLDKEYLLGFANQIALAIENARMYTELKQGFLVAVQALAGALEAKDSYTRGHSERVARYSVRLARELNLPEDMLDKIRNMCLIHDIGKIGIEGNILNKRERLLDRELDHIREHPLIGRRIIEPLNLSSDEIAVVRHHHERLDGGGYPEGLTADQIPVHVRVTTLCDAFDAMTSNRPYRNSLPIDKALLQLEQGAGTQFDPDMVDIFIDMVKNGELQDIISEPGSVQAAG